MDEDLKNVMREKLQQLKIEVLNALIADNNYIKIAVEDIGAKDIADIASNDIDVRLWDAVGIKEKARLQRIEAALFRLETGRFGICASCGSKISKARLEAIPYVLMCVDCQTKSEKRKLV